MKIVSKEIKPDGSQFIVYLMDETERPLKAKITNKEEKTELINNLLKKNTEVTLLSHEDVHLSANRKTKSKK